MDIILIVLAFLTLAFISWLTLNILATIILGILGFVFTYINKRRDKRWLG